jgi:uncharacterized protein (TIGR03437 family)
VKLSRVLCAVCCSVVFGWADNPPASVTVTATDSGWFDNEGRTQAYPGNPRFANYAVGWDPVDFSDAVVLRDFFIFDLSGVSGTITSATLDLYMPASPPDSGNGYLSYEPSEPYQVTSTSSSVNELSLIYLQGNPIGETIFSTLGTGTVFAFTTVSAANDGTTIHIALNAAALQFLNSNQGQSIALSGQDPAAPTSGPTAPSCTGTCRFFFTNTDPTGSGIFRKTPEPTLTLNFATSATPTISSVVDQAAATTNLTPGMPIQVVGTGFGNSSTDSATVMIGNEAAPVLTFVSSTNLIVQAPVDAALGATALTVSYKGQVSTPFSIKLTALAPEIEPPQTPNGSSFYDASGNAITAAHPAIPDTEVYCLAIGLGTTNPPQVLNTVATVQAPATQQVQVMVGAKMVQPDYAGLFVGGMPGFYQVSFQVPADAAIGNQPVTLLVGGLTSNTQTLVVAPPVPVINAIVNGATFAPGPAPQAANSFVSVFGLNFGSEDTAANIFPATTFKGLSVLVNNTPVPLYFVVGTGGQINIVLPSELGASGSASVEVVTSEGSSAPFQLALTADSVGIFRITDPSKPTRHNGAVLFTNTAWKVMPLSMAEALGLPNCSTVTTASICGKPAKANDQIEIYLTGLGKATPNGDPNGKVLPTGSLAPTAGSVLYKTIETPVVKIGGVPADVSFSGIAPGNAGQYQINVQVPSGVTPGDDVTLQITMPDGSVDTVTIAITAS